MRSTPVTSPRLRALLEQHPELATAALGGDDSRDPAMTRTLLHVVTDWPGHFPNGPEIVATLVDAGADVNARFTGPHTETPLHWAASSDDVAVLDALLDAGADIEAPGAVIGGGTPMADATAFGQWHAARRLLERGARTTLWEAAALGLLDRVDGVLPARPVAVDGRRDRSVLGRLSRRAPPRGRVPARPRCRHQLGRLGRSHTPRRRAAQRCRRAGRVAAEPRRRTASTYRQISVATPKFPSVRIVAAEFDDLLAANRVFAESFELSGFDGVAHAGVAVVTCMDSRIDPLRMLGLRPGDAKIFRNPGGRVTQAALEALVLGVHLLGVERILVVPHTKCLMASYTEDELRSRVSASSGQDASWKSFGVIADQIASLHEDVRKVQTHPLIPATVSVGGFLYDVDTGLIEQKF